MSWAQSQNRMARRKESDANREERAQVRVQQEAIRQEGIQRRNELNAMIAASMEKGEDVPYVDEQADAMYNALNERERAQMPDFQGSAPDMVAQEGEYSMNMPKALETMYRGGRGMDAFAIQQKMRNKKLEEINRQGQINQGMMDRFSGGGGMQPGQTLKIKPSGPEFGFDPAKGATTRLAQEKAQYERGGQPSGGMSERMRSNLPAKMQNELQKQRGAESIKGDQSRFNKLRESSASRQSAMGKAKKFLDMFKSGDMKSGAGRTTASYLPGVYSEQGQLDEEFNAFAEIAARQALKASGEIRPTDADVKGMKQAMFGVGRDEQTNIMLLEDYLAQQGQDESDYQLMMDKARGQMGITKSGQVVAPDSGELKLGTVKDGYVFNGGDPANPNSWTKQ